MTKATERLERIEALLRQRRERQIERVIIYRDDDELDSLVAENRRRFGNEHVLVAIPHNGRDSLPGRDTGPTAGASGQG